MEATGYKVVRTDSLGQSHTDSGDYAAGLMFKACEEGSQGDDIKVFEVLYDVLGEEVEVTLITHVTAQTKQPKGDDVD